MFKTLLKIKLASIWSGIARANSQKRRSTGTMVLLALLMVYVIVVFFGMFFAMFSTLCRPLYEAGLSWMYFALAGIMATLLAFIGSVFTTQAQLYEAKDNELLLSMPVKPSCILASRMAALILLNLFFELLVLAPAGIAYCMQLPVTVQGVVLYLIEVLLLPFLSLTLSCIFGWVIALITSRVRNKNLVSMVLSLLLIAAYFLVYSQINTLIQKILGNATLLAEKIQQIFYPFYCMGVSSANGEIGEALLFVVCIAVPFALVYMLLSRSFIKIATSKKGAAKIVYREKQMKVRSAQSALFHKEMRRFFSNPMYVLNASFGIVLVIAGIVLLLIERNVIYNFLQQGGEQIAGNMIPLAAAAVSMLSSTNFISAPSVSLEGKSLWIVKSMPVDGSKALLAKAYVHMAICIPPVVVCSAVLAVVLRASVVSAILLVLLPAVLTALFALLGVAINLKLPKLDWVNEIAVIKQSASSAASMFVNMGIVLALFLIYLFVGSAIGGDLYLLICTLVSGLFCWLLVKFLKGKGKQIFENL